MICQSCYEILTKTHDYRINTVSNDKLLKEQCGQPYTPPVNNQEEILLLATKVFKELLIAYHHNCHTVEHIALHSQSEHSTINHESENVSKVSYKHPSVHKLFKQYKNIKIPEQVFECDVLPVISLDSAEVSEWSTKQANCIQNNIPVIKEISSSTASYCKSDTSLTMGVDLDIDNDNGSYNTDKEGFVFNHHIKIDGSAISGTYNVLSNQLNKETTLHLINPVHQKAKKKAGRKSLSKRKRFSKTDEDVIPAKKVRTSRKRTSKELIKVDLPKQLPNNKTQQKVIFTSSLELSPLSSSTVLVAPPSDSAALVLPALPSIANTNLPIPISKYTAPLLDHADSLNIMNAGKLLTVFTCALCNKVYDSRKELTAHEKIHLKCKFCKTKFKNIVHLQKHLRETCFINMVENPPTVKLTKVESIEIIVKKYPEAFKELFEHKPPMLRMTSVATRSTNIAKIAIS